MPQPATALLHSVSYKDKSCRVPWHLIWDHVPWCWNRTILSDHVPRGRLNNGSGISEYLQLWCNFFSSVGPCCSSCVHQGHKDPVQLGIGSRFTPSRGIWAVWMESVGLVCDESRLKQEGALGCLSPDIILTLYLSFLLNTVMKCVYVCRSHFKWCFCFVVISFL